MAGAAGGKRVQLTQFEQPLRSCACIPADQANSVSIIRQLDSVKGAIQVRQWLTRVGVRTLFIESGCPWENGYIESFNGKLRDELLDREIFDTLLEAKVLIEPWRREYNTIRPQSALGYRPPAPEAREWCSFAPATPPLTNTTESFIQKGH